MDLVECYPFTFSGCGGNANVFKSFDACKAACIDQGNPAVNRDVGSGADPRFDGNQDLHHLNGTKKDSSSLVRCDQVICF